MYFGDYLVSQNVITHEQLVLSLIYQIESLPSFHQVLFDEKIIKPDVFLELLKNEAKDEKLDFISQLISKKLVSEEKIQELFLKQQVKKIPLGEVLCRLNFSSSEIINSHLKKFYDNKFHELTESKSENKSSNVEISSAALESLKELGMDLNSQKVEILVPENPFIDHYLELFSEKFKNKVLKLLQIMKKTVEEKGDISNYINSLYRDIHLIKSAVLLAELKLIEDFIFILDDKIEKQLTSDSSKLASWFNKNYDLFEQSLNTIWNYTKHLEKSKSDASIQNDQELVKIISGLSEDLTNI